MTFPLNAVSMVVIDGSGDLVVQVSEYDDEVSGPDDEHPIISETVDFKVNREVLMASSPVFKKLLNSQNFAEARKDTVSLRGDHVASMDIWFRVLHGVGVDKTSKILVDEIWFLLAACDKYDLNIEDLKDWFALWYDMQNVELLESSELLYPCWIFDHSKGFAAATKSLAYEETGHITEHNPTIHSELHLPSRIIRKLSKYYYSSGGTQYLTRVYRTG